MRLWNILGSLALVLCVCVGCGKDVSCVVYDNVKVDKSVSDVIDSYFTQAQNSESDSVYQILYFKPTNEIEREAYQTNREYDIYPTGATVYKVDKINDSLYAITLHVDMSIDEEDADKIVYNFVVNIDGEWKYILAAHNIPDDVLDGGDLSQYDYDDDSILEADDVIQS